MWGQTQRRSSWVGTAELQDDLWWGQRVTRTGQGTAGRQWAVRSSHVGDAGAGGEDTGRSQSV